MDDEASRGRQGTHLNEDIGWMIHGRLARIRCCLTRSLMWDFFEPNNFIANRLSVEPKMFESWFFTQPDLNSLFTDVLHKFKIINFPLNLPWYHYNSAGQRA